MKEKCSYFLIDDDPEDRDIFEMALEDINTHCYLRSAINGVEALEIIEKEPDFIPDFIFLDLNMPFLSGLECLKAIRKIQRLKEVTIIIYSTSSNERDVECSKQLGASHFFVKPSSISLLSEILDELFMQKSLPFKVEHDF